MKTIITWMLILHILLVNVIPDAVPNRGEEKQSLFYCGTIEFAYLRISQYQKWRLNLSPADGHRLAPCYMGIK